jgi:hypothetical protein
MTVWGKLGRLAVEGRHTAKLDDMLFPTSTAAEACAAWGVKIIRGKKPPGE